MIQLSRYLRLEEHKIVQDESHKTNMTDYAVLMRYGFGSEMMDEIVKNFQSGRFDHPYLTAMFDRETAGIKDIYVSMFE